MVQALIFTGSYSSASEFTFTSKLDRFTVEVTDGRAVYNGHEVTSEPFKLIKPIFEHQLIEPCTLGLGKPDLTITRKRNDKEEKRIVYIEKQIVSDGKNCGEITGQGLYELPLHHNWFEGKKSVTINLKNSFSIWKSDLLVVDFEKN